MEDEKKITIDNEDDESTETTTDLGASDEINSDDSADSTESISAEIENLKAELAAKNDRLLRLQADFDNFRKRTAKEKIELSATIEQGFLKDLLPLLDNLNRASDAAEAENATAETLHKGIEMIKQETVAALGKHGLEPIDTEGQKFDPNFHQAVGTVQDETKEDGDIAAEFQRGYIARGRVIRPAMVQVVDNS